MPARIAKGLVVVALTLSLGAHWALLQSVAWAGMVIAYSQDGAVGEALSKTFDGEHPCQLCQFVQAGRRAESKHQQALKLEAKKQIVCEAATVALCPPSEFTLLPRPRFSGSARAERPPLPPPRVRLG